MNIRERWKCVLNHREPDQVPIQDAPWEATIERWRQDGLPGDISVSDYFGYEMAWFWPDVGPQFGCKIVDESAEYLIQQNQFGEVVKNHRDRSTTPQIIDSPIKTKKDWEEIKSRFVACNSRLVTPSDVLNPITFVSLEEALIDFRREREKGRFITYGVISGYDLLQHYLGSERLLIAIALEPEWIKEMHETMTRLAIDMHELMIQKGFKFDGVFLADDLGYRNGLLFSPERYKQMFFPADHMLCNYFRGQDMPVILHSDGCVKELIPYFIEAGFSCLQPLEVKAGMDVRELKREYGDRLSFMGGIDVRLMGAQDSNLIEEEIKSKFSVVKKGGGYIYHSDHSVPHDVSLKQYERVVKLVKKYGKY